MSYEEEDERKPVRVTLTIVTQDRNETTEVRADFDTWQSSHNFVERSKEAFRVLSSHVEGPPDRSPAPASTQCAECDRLRDQLRDISLTASRAVIK